MGILSKLTDTASSGLTIGTVMAKTMSLATFTALDASLQASKVASEFAFTYVEEFVRVAEEALEKSGSVGDRVTNIAFVAWIIFARAMPTQVSKLVRMLKIFDEEAIDKFEALIESIVVIIEEGDLKSLEETISDIVEAGLFGVTVLQPNLLLALFMIMQIIITGAATLVERDMVGEEEAFTRARNICGKIWRSYGEVYHGQEWIGFENIPETDGALIIYYHGAVPVDYFCLVAELWLQRGREVHSVVDRSLMQIPYMDNLRKHMKLFPGTVDTCADLLESGELLGIAPGGAYESLFGDSNYPVLWQSRVGFAKVAIKANKPIIPVFTENIRENTVTLAGRMTIGKEMWERLYRSTKMPVVPMYGLFPVKLRTHIGAPIYPRAGQTPEELSRETCEAVRGMIASHQQLPGTITQALAARMEDAGRLSRSSSRLSLAGERLSRSSSRLSLASESELPSVKVTTVDIVAPTVGTAREE